MKIKFINQSIFQHGICKKRVILNLISPLRLIHLLHAFQRYFLNTQWPLLWPIRNLWINLKVLGDKRIIFADHSFDHLQHLLFIGACLKWAIKTIDWLWKVDEVLVAEIVYPRKVIDYCDTSHEEGGLCFFGTRIVFLDFLYFWVDHELWQVLVF